MLPTVGSSDEWNPLLFCTESSRKWSKVPTITGRRELAARQRENWERISGFGYRWNDVEYQSRETYSTTKWNKERALESRTRKQASKQISNVSTRRPTLAEL